MKLLFFILVNQLLVNAQPNLDSIMRNISKDPDTTKIRILNDYTWTYRSKDPTAALRSGQEALRIALTIENKSLQAKSLNLIGVVYRNLGDYDKAITYYKDALRNAEAAKDSLQIAFSNNNIGGIYRLIGNNPLSLEHILRALNIFERLNNKEGMAFCTINIGLVYKNQGDFVKALEYLNYTLRIRNEINDNSGKALTNNLIAEVYFDMGEYNLALDYYREAESGYKKIDDQKGIAAVWGGIGGVYYSQNNLKDALKYRLQALDLSHKIQYKEGRIINHNNLALIYAKLGDLNKAEFNLAESQKLTSDMKAAYVILQSYRFWSQYYEIRKDYIGALKYNNKYIMLKDSLLNQENIALVRSMESIYKAEKAEKEKSVLEKDVELKEKQRNYLIVIALLILAIAVVTYNRYHSKKLANEKLKELNAVKDTFFRLIAHDLKTPFNAIFGYTEILKEDFSDLSDEEKLSFIDDIGKAAKQNYQLLENLLIWSQSQAGRLEFNPERINMKEIISESKDLLIPSAKNKNIVLNVECENDIFIRVDEQMITTVFRNLISNAIKFTHVGGHVTINVGSQSNGVKISIEDNGIGMDETTVEKLFRIDRIETKNGTQGEKGTGLGLILCKDFVERHNGQIWVESKPGIGSKFIFTLPF
ncbi:MAG: tetratricopeptide repeat-containing sensor histidine kinase [Bacteroidota bacterium]